MSNLGSFNHILEKFEIVHNTFVKSKAMTKLANGEITLDHYKAILREIYFYTREDPQQMGVLSAYMRGPQRKNIKQWLRHAISEVNHDQLALDDLKALGENTEQIPLQNPLPSTMALTSFQYHQIINLNPIGYLGCVFFLEFLPTKSGSQIMDSLRESGVPETAMTFIADHATVDVHHNQAMEQYCEEMILDQHDLDAVAYAMQVTGYLYANMLDGALSSVNEGGVVLSPMVERTVTEHRTVSL